LTIRICTWGTTTWQWNYVLVLRRHREVFTKLHPYRRHHHVAFVELRPVPEVPPRPPVELRPFVEAPPGTPLKRIHGITSNRWGATNISHYKRHGIMPYPYFNHVPPTIQEFLITIISCKINSSYNPCFSIHTKSTNMPFPFQMEHINHAIITQPIS